MRISKISTPSFNGIIRVKGNMNIWCKDKQICTSDGINKYQRDIKKVFSGSSASINNNINLSGNSKDTGCYLSGLVEIDTDRIEEITPKEIILKSDGRTCTCDFIYNQNLNPLRQLLAINAYNVAKNDNILVAID